MRVARLETATEPKGTTRMKVSDAFPSKWLRADDVGDRPIPVTIADVRQEEVGDDQRMVLYVEGQSRGIILNKTNANRIKELYGNDTDDWVGERVALYTELVSFQGKTTNSIRVREAPAAKGKSKGKSNGFTEDNPPPIDEAPAWADELNDEIPL